MIFNVSRHVVMLAVVLTAFYIGPVNAAKVSKGEVKSTCSTAGGSYSEGSNYGRCEYSNGDSYTCNTDVNKCESCTNGKCTVSIKQPGTGGAPSGEPTATIKKAK